jgi:hypothetical protein
MIRLGLGGALVAERKKAELCWTDPTMARAGIGHPTLRKPRRVG